MSTSPAAPPARRELPHSIDAERMVLAGILIDNATFAHVAGIRPKDFYRPAHERIFLAIQQLITTGTQADLVTLKNQLGADIASVGGAAYLSELLDGVPRVSNVKHWAGIVREHSMRRTIHRLGAWLADQAAGDEFETRDLLERADAALLKLTRRGGEGRGLQDNARLAKEALANIEARSQAPGGVLGYRTEITPLDDVLQGVREGTVLIVAARPSEGKTILAVQIGEAIAHQVLGHGRGGGDKVVVLASLEMSGAEIMERRLAKAAFVNPNRLWCAPEDEKQKRFDRLARAYGELAKSNLRVLPDAWTVTEIRSWCRQAQQEYGLGAVVVDYVQLMDAEKKAGFRKRFEEVSDISKALKRMANELQVPVIVAAQLNRELMAGGKRRAPELSDLAESGQLERDAHQVVMIEKDPPAERGAAKSRSIAYGAADLWIRKNRNGRTDRVRLRLNGAMSCFMEWSDSDKPHAENP